MLSDAQSDYRVRLSWNCCQGRIAMLKGACCLTTGRFQEVSSLGITAQPQVLRALNRHSKSVRCSAALGWRQSMVSLPQRMEIGSPWRSRYRLILSSFFSMEERSQISARHTLPCDAAKTRNRRRLCLVRYHRSSKSNLKFKLGINSIIDTLY